MKKRGPEDNRQMLYLAHASRHHWGLVGSPRNQAVGEWQLSRVYVELGQSKLALQFAKASLAKCKRFGLTDIVHTANEAISRAYAVAGEYDAARRYLQLARQKLDCLTLDREDKEVYLDQIRDTEALIHKR
jgi:hypothetical protein